MCSEEQILKMNVLKLSISATLPSKSTSASAAFDLSAAHAACIPPGENGLIFTDLSIEFPPGVYGRIAGRSGLALYQKIVTAAGVIDPDFRGNIGVVLFNQGVKNFEIKTGDRIAQLICECYVSPIVSEVTFLNDTERGDRGFGSTYI